MICNNCGKEISSTMKFCAYCGASVFHGTNNNQNNMQQNADPLKTVYHHEPSGVDSPENPKHPYVPPKKKGGKATVIIMGIIIVALIAVIAILLMQKNESDGLAKVEIAEKKEIVFEINDYPKISENLSYCLTGTVLIPDSGGALSINGKTVTEFEEDSGEVSWSKELWFENGENIFEIVLSDGKKDLRKETVKITFEPELLYPKGTILVKSDDAGIFIRPTPAITHEFILYIPEYDYTTQLMCQGAEYIDGDKHTWCKVKVPDGKVGWVRDDIIRSLY